MRRRRFLGDLGLVLGVLILSAGVASAQGGRRGGMGRGQQGGLQLLRIVEVQKELKMTPEQTGKVEGKQQEVREALQTQFPGGGGGGGGQLSPEEREKRTARQVELNTKAVMEILTDPAQQKRFRQLELQQQGPIIIALRKDVAAELKLTEEQQKKLVEIQRMADEERRGAFQGVDFGNMTDEERTKLFAKMQDMQKTTGEKVVAVLTDAQKTQWKEMLGAPFTFPAPGPGGPGGGARRTA